LNINLSNYNYKMPSLKLGWYSASIKFQVSETAKMSEGKWLFFVDSITSLEDFFADIYIPFDCEFLVAQRSNGTEDGDLEVSLTEVYNVHPTRPLQINPVARWSYNIGLIVWCLLPWQKRRPRRNIVEVWNGSRCM
jgi:hypothetical protein